VIQITAAGIVNAASFLAGPVVPGELVTIFGTGFGPSTLATLQLTTNRLAITNLLGETRVLFDGVPAPMVYTSDGQLSAIVPYSVFGKTTTQVQVEYQGLLSNSLSLNVGLASPAIFSSNSSGTGPGAVLNQNSSVNSAANPALRNTIVQIFATGEGQTTPVGSDGKLAVSPLPKPILPVTVTIGGFDAPVTYAGGAPGLVAGVIQINARIATQVQPGDSIPVILKIGGVTSQTGITIAVR
jgi:IPT/TIG domain.